jgi:uncharacterized membrane protein HdeD (DUF308 family)
MMSVLARNWWALVIRGVAALLFGLAALFWPGIALTVLVLLFGAYALVDGVFAVIAAVRAAGHEPRWWAVLIEGIIGILAGAVTLAWPGITALALVYVIAAWAVITGIAEVAAAIKLRKEISGEWLLALGGIVSVLFGIYLAIAPGAGALALVWIIGIYAIFWGIVLIALGFRLRGWQPRVSDQPHHTTEPRAA